MCVCVCVCVCVRVCSNIFSETTGPIEAKFHYGTSMEYGKKAYSNGPGGGPGHLLFFIIVNLRGAGTFSRDFTINLSPQCRAFSRALKIEKLKAPLFPGRGGDYKWLVH